MDPVGLERNEKSGERGVFNVRGSEAGRKLAEKYETWEIYLRYYHSKVLNLLCTDHVTDHALMRWL